MCNTCGCNITKGNEHLIQGDGALAKTAEGKATIEVLKNLLSENDHQALHNREHFDEYGVLAINLMSSPGSGKTALLEATIQALKSEFSLAVIEGDLETENDAERIRAHGVPAVQIVTGTACHLDAHLVHHALHDLALAPLDIVFIENVGNLVCPASFDLGHHRNVTVLSVTEGDDKPAKYPVMFRAADVVLLSKIDLLPHLEEFSLERAAQQVRNLANPAPIFSLSAKTKEGLDAWFDWIRQEVVAQKLRVQQGKTALPAMQPDGARLHGLAQHGHTHSHA